MYLNLIKRVLVVVVDVTLNLQSNPAVAANTAERNVFFSVDSFLNDKIEIPRTNKALGKKCPLNERFRVSDKHYAPESCP